MTKFNGARYRFRSIPDVIDEIEQIAEKRFFIADDSIVGLGAEGIAHAKKLFRSLKGMKKIMGLPGLHHHRRA